MALYGIDFYGASRYGPRVFLDFDASPMRAISRDYGKIHVSWYSPGGNWSILRVVRNAYGVPVSQVDGQILVNTNSGPAATGTIDPPANNTIDTDLVGGRFYYYAVWLYVPSIDEWTRAAYTTGLAVADYGYSDRLWTLTPSIHRTTSGALLDQDNETLKTYLKIQGFQLDHIRAEYETLRHVNDPHKVAGGLLPIMAHQYGQFFEPELGMAQMRKLLASTVYLYRNKGTVPGIEGFVKAVSGFGAKVLPLKNLILDYNDSSAEESIGNAEPTAATITRRISDDVIASPGEFYEGQRREGMFQITATGPSLVGLRLFWGVAGTAGDSRFYSIPVTGGLPYALSAYVRAATVGRAWRAVFMWRDADGNSISTSQIDGIGSDVVGDWTRIAATATAPLKMATPSNVTVTNAGTPGSTTYSYRVVAWNGSGVSASQSVTTTTGNATLSATDYNTISWDEVEYALEYWIYGRTPGGEYYLAYTLPPTTTWNDTGTAVPDTGMPAPSGNTSKDAVYCGVGLRMPTSAVNEVHYLDCIQLEQNTVATDFEDARLIDIQVFAPRVNLFKNPAPTSTAYISSQGGTASFTGGKYRLTSDGTGGVSADGISRIQFSDTPLEAGQTVTVSVYVTLSQARNVNLQEMWAYSVSPTVAVPANTRTRVSATFTTPAGGLGAGISFQLQTLAAAAGETIDIDSVLVEKGAALFDYFDGTTHAFTAESMWEGTPNASRSHYYPQRKTKNYRMNALLKDYTPMGSSYRLRYALGS